MKSVTEAELKFIHEAQYFLERESFLIRLANTVGKPANVLQKALPQVVQKGVTKAVHKSLNAALKTSLLTLKDAKPGDWEKQLSQTNKDRLLHGGLAASSGAMGGFFGAAGLIFELPVTTTIMMRNIAAIANDFGFSKTDPNTALECLYVFSLGTRSISDDNFDSAYYSSRMAMSAALRNSAQYIAASGTKVLFDSLRKGSAPIVINFIARVATYFEIVVTEKMIAGAVPIIGSIGAASINAAFTDYFGQAAKYHFGLLALERKYGQEVIQKIYSDKKELTSTAKT